MLLFCKRCKCDIEKPYSTRKYCIECAKERRRESARLWAKLNRPSRGKGIRIHWAIGAKRLAGFILSGKGHPL